MQNPSVSIVIPCYNEVNYIEKCIRSTQTQSFQEGQLDVIVVDGMSDDGTREVLLNLQEEFPNLQLVDNPERHTPKALNLGIEASSSDMAIILGAHAELEPSFVALNVEAMLEHEQAGCVGGMIINVYENETAEVIGKAMGSRFGVGNARFRTGGKKGYVDTVAFGAYRRTALNEIGLFDLDLVRNQDDEINFRLNKHGWKIWFDPKIRSKYYVRASYSKLFKQYKQYGYWKVYVNKKHQAVTSIRQMIPFFFVAFIALATIVAFTPLGPGPLILGLMLWFIGAMVATIASKASSRQYNGMLATFFILHTAYGLGYAQGIWHFLILGKTPSRTAKASTR